MGAAAEWADISPFPRGAGEDAPLIGMWSVTNLSWAQQRAAVSAAPLFGERRQWLGYSAETTGYGSLELCGPLAYRVTIVHPDDSQALRQHHRMVRSGRLRTARYWRRIALDHVHVIERAELCRSRADARGSWLFAAQAVARLCGADDEVAWIAGPALRRLLWAGRAGLGPELTATITELRDLTESLAAERRRYLAAVEQSIRDDLETIQLEIRTLAEVRRDWAEP